MTEQNPQDAASQRQWTRALLNAALGMAYEENDYEALDRLGHSLRGDGTPWFTDTQRRLILTSADRISDRADREATEALKEASEKVRDGLTARLRADQIVSDTELAREFDGGRLLPEHYRNVRATRFALQAGRRQPITKGSNVDH